MKLYIRLVLISPFLLLCYILTRHLRQVDGCNGLIEMVIYIVYFFFLLVSCILFIIGIARKRESPERITLVIVSLAALTVILTVVFEDRTHGVKWFEARNRTANLLFGKSVLFQTNGTLAYTRYSVDFAYFTSETVRIVGDTLALDKQLIDQIESGLSKKYIRTDSTFIPLHSNQQESSTLNAV